MERKRCSKCGKTRLLSKFSKNKSEKDGYGHQCKKCVSEYNQSEKGKELRKRNFKRYCQSEEGKKARKKTAKRYRQTKNGKEVKKRYYQSKKSKEAVKRYRQNNINICIAMRLRTRIWHALQGKVKSASTMKLLGCNIKDFLAHLESQFEEGMTWKNYGSYWEMHHIIPCAAFDLSDPKEQRKCFHYSNLQPLYWKDNLIKGSKVA